MGRATRRRADWAVGVLGLVGLTVSVVLGWRRLRFGDVDPASLVVGVASLAAAVWPMWRGRRQENDVTLAADRLARTVGAVERQERARLLGDDDQALDLDLRIETDRRGQAAVPATGLRLSELTDHFRSLPAGQRRLVISGAPGAGKTVLALQLMLDLLSRRDPGDAVPVRLSLPAWPPDTSLEDWLVAALRDDYGLNTATAEALVEDRRILPVLDGLDEMDGAAKPGYESRSAHAVRAIDTYRAGTGKADVVLTCRTRTCRALRAIKVWPRDATCVHLAPVRPATVREFVARRCADPDRWAPLLRQLDEHPQGTLAQGLSTPWRLTAAVTAYEQRAPVTGAWAREPAELRTVARRGAAALRDWLNEQYLRARAATGPYSEEQVYGWLSLLAAAHPRGPAPARTATREHAAARPAGATGQRRTASERSGAGQRGTAGGARPVWRRAGRTAPGHDIVLQRLASSSGSVRPRNLAFVLAWLCPVAAFGTAMALSGTLVQPISHLTTVLVVCAECWAIRQRIDREPPSRLHVDVRRLATVRGALLFGWRFATGLVLGFLLMLLSVAAFTYWAGGSLGLELPLAAGLATGLANATVFGLGADSASLAVRPNDLIRNDVVSAVVGLVPAALLCAVVVGGQGPVPFVSYDLRRGALLGTALLAVPTGVGLVFATGVGLQAVRYLAFLLSFRRFRGSRLPLRLGRLLAWCHGAGLVRVSGAAYQFRHRELQDHLARHTEE
ncbi:hypothetical protein Athai_46290 [Actinocatenispora thailandica]|uniref:NACHT domain-containing protein n=1 Tax=Actinocatenispora thailandica TaxID=227318 RepID=A0A7R7DSV4_9ACTN|nr:NACHT domain-containing protein [Actinocatenispora thailandica]BCJ37126.1 hypothetical protein Athai_46290 [Actinocatenispora thailandica]